VFRSFVKGVFKRWLGLSRGFLRVVELGLVLGFGGGREVEKEEGGVKGGVRGVIFSSKGVKELGR
jgi:hypothetical protein